MLTARDTTTRQSSWAGRFGADDYLVGSHLRTEELMLNGLYHGRSLKARQPVLSCGRLQLIERRKVTYAGKVLSFRRLHDLEFF